MRISRTTAASVMKAMIRMSASQSGQRSGKTHRLQYLDRAILVGLVILRHRTALHVRPGLLAQLLHVGEKRLCMVLGFSSRRHGVSFHRALLHAQGYRNV